MLWYGSWVVMLLCSLGLITACLGIHRESTAIRGSHWTIVIAGLLGTGPENPDCRSREAADDYVSATYGVEQAVTQHLEVYQHVVQPLTRS